MKYVFYHKEHGDTQTNDWAYIEFLNDFHIFLNEKDKLYNNKVFESK